MAGGRPTVMTDEVLAKLEYVFAMGGTDTEAIFYAGISKDALYDYQKEHPEFTERKEALKESPILKARTTVIESLEHPDHAKWYLERKTKGEFANQQKNYNAEITNSETMTEEQKSNLNELLGL